MDTDIPRTTQRSPQLGKFTAVLVIAGTAAAIPVADVLFGAAAFGPAAPPGYARTFARLAFMLTVILGIFCPLLIPRRWRQADTSSLVNILFEFIRPSLSVAMGALAVVDFSLFFSKGDYFLLATAGFAVGIFLWTAPFQVPVALRWLGFSLFCLLSFFATHESEFFVIPAVAAVVLAESQGVGSSHPSATGSVLGT